MVYQFKKGAVIPRGVTVEDTERALEEVERRHGKVTVETITDDVEADPRGHLLRDWFEWDDELCVRKYHEIQASQIVRAVVVSELVPNHSTPVRAWVITHENGEQIYKRMQYVIREPDRVQELLGQIRREKKAYDDKLEELLTLVELIAGAGRRQP